MYREAQNPDQTDITLKEASFKIGQYYHHGWGGVERNLTTAIRNYEMAQAESHIESMDALGSLCFYERNEYE